jgi:hypothetical protein
MTAKEYLIRAISNRSGISLDKSKALVEKISEHQAVRSICESEVSYQKNSIKHAK